MLVSLLQAHPGASVAALDGLGRMVSYPSTLPLAGHHVVEGGTPFEIVAPAARVGMVDTWLRAKESGSASAAIVLVNGSAGVYHVIDLRDRHGVMVGMIVGESDLAFSTVLSNRQAVLPRMGRVHKDELGVFTFADDNIARILAVDVADLVGSRSLDFIHPDDQPPPWTHGSRCSHHRVAPAGFGHGTGAVTAHGGGWRSPTSIISNMRSVR